MLVDHGSVLPFLLVHYGSLVHIRLVAIAHTAALACAATGVLLAYCTCPASCSKQLSDLRLHVTNCDFTP